MAMSKNTAHSNISAHFVCARVRSPTPNILCIITKNRGDVPRGNRLPCIPLSHINFAYCILVERVIFFSLTSSFIQLFATTFYAFSEATRAKYTTQQNDKKTQYKIHKLSSGTYYLGMLNNVWHIQREQREMRVLTTLDDLPWFAVAIISAPTKSNENANLTIATASSCQSYFQNENRRFRSLSIFECVSLCIGVSYTKNCWMQSVCFAWLLSALMQHSHDKT